MIDAVMQAARMAPSLRPAGLVMDLQRLGPWYRADSASPVA